MEKAQINNMGDLLLLAEPIVRFKLENSGKPLFADLDLSDLCIFGMKEMLFRQKDSIDGTVLADDIVAAIRERIEEMAPAAEAPGEAAIKVVQALVNDSSDSLMLDRFNPQTGKMERFNAALCSTGVSGKRVFCELTDKGKLFLACARYLVDMSRVDAVVLDDALMSIYVREGRFEEAIDTLGQIKGSLEESSADVRRAIRKYEAGTIEHEKVVGFIKTQISYRKKAKEILESRLGEYRASLQGAEDGENGDVKARFMDEMRSLIRVFGHACNEASESYDRLFGANWFHFPSHDASGASVRKTIDALCSVSGDEIGEMADVFLHLFYGEPEEGFVKSGFLALMKDAANERQPREIEAGKISQAQLPDDLPTSDEVAEMISWLRSICKPGDLVSEVLEKAIAETGFPAFYILKMLVGSWSMDRRRESECHLRMTDGTFEAGGVYGNDLRFAGGFPEWADCAEALGLSSRGEER